MRLAWVCLFSCLVGCTERAIGTSVDGGAPPPADLSGPPRDLSAPPRDLSGPPRDLARVDLAGPAYCSVSIGCPAGQYCQLAEGCGDYAQIGTCQPIPSACTKELAPVCGCDGNTYSNTCLAQQAGVSVLHKGACESPPLPACGPSGAVCGANEYCDFASSCGKGEDDWGICRTRPQACTDEWAPVCGCDGKTYGNACSAYGSGTDVAFTGECPKASDCRTTGCPVGKKCELCWTDYLCLDTNVAC